MKTFLKSLGKLAAVAFILNEVRGIVIAVPVMYGLYQAGGTLMAIWLAVCSLAGIVLSVVVPIVVQRIWKRRQAR